MRKATDATGPSPAERRRAQLQARLEAREIEELAERPGWPIVVYGERICVVVADFGYRDVQRGTHIAEFINPPRSALHLLQKKLLKACHGVEASEVRV